MLKNYLSFLNIFQCYFFFLLLVRINMPDWRRLLLNNYLVRLRRMVLNKCTNAQSNFLLY